MYKTIMVPVDLQHAGRLEKALQTAADLASHYDATACYVAVTANTPGPLGHTPQEFAQKLEAFGRGQAEKHGHRAETRTMVSHDPAVDLDDKLLEAAHETGADLVVIASHIPGVMDAVWPSHGGKLASHADVSVLVVR